MPPGSPVTCVDRLWERSRLEWRLGDPGEPAELLAAFLAELGLFAGSPARGGGPAPASGPAPGGGPTPGGHGDSGVCGAAVLISAAAAARIAGAPTGPPTPAPAVPDVVAVGYEHGARRPAGERPGKPWALGAWVPTWRPAEHAAAVSAVRAAIARGDVYQVNVVGHGSAAYRGDPLPALHRATRLPGTRYAGLLTGAGWAVACASPETLVQVRGDRVSTAPIKGTRPATAAGRAELLGSAKERAEHVMIVDLARNDLGRVARTGSVRVDRLYAVRRWCDLWQAESVVSARLAGGVGLAELLSAVCPGGSVTGAPKLAALAQIAGLEPVGRGPAMGALGWVGTGGLDLGLTIRTVAADGQRLHLWAGGGITWDSDPLAEVAEADAKAAPLRSALAEHRGQQHLVDVEGLAGLER